MTRKPIFGRRTLTLTCLASVASFAVVWAAGATSIGTDISTDGVLSAYGNVNFQDPVAAADSINIGDTSDTVTVLGDISLFDDQWSIASNGAAGFASLDGTPIGNVTRSNGAFSGLSTLNEMDIGTTNASEDVLHVKVATGGASRFNGYLTNVDLSAGQNWYLPDATGIIPVGTAGNSLFFTTAGATNVTLPTSGILATLAGSETLTNKTLTSPVIATGNGIYTSAGASAPAIGIYGMPANVNYIEVGSGAAGGPPGIAIKTTGADVNVGLNLGLLGTGNFVLQSTAANADRLALAPKVGGGSAFTGTLTSADLTVARSWIFPDAGGTISLEGHTHDATDITSGNLDLTGNAIIGGTFAANGNVTLGDASGDGLTINSGALSAPNGLSVDSGTFIIDATNNRVGIGTNPSWPFHISAGNVGADTRGAYIEVADATTTAAYDATKGLEILTQKAGAGAANNAELFGLKSEVSFTALDAGTEIGYGVYGRVQNAQQAYGVYADAQGISATGVVASGSAGAGGTAYGLVGYASGGDTNYGVYVDMTGNPGANYGVYSSVAGGSPNWAGYFQEGDVYIKNNLGLGTTTPSATLTVGADKFTVAGATGNITTAGTLTVGGAVISGFLQVTSSLNFPSIAANSCIEMGLGVVGAVVGETVALSVPAAFENGLMAMSWISVDNSATIRVCNVTGSIIDPAAGNFRVEVWKH